MRLLERFAAPRARGERAYDFTSVFQTWDGADEGERSANDFCTYVAEGYKGNGIVFACILARAMLFSEVEFKFRRLADKELFGTPALGILENPWPNGTTGELLWRMEQDVSLAGNFYAWRSGKTLQRLRPDWVEIVSSKTRDPQSGMVSRKVLGYLYYEGGKHSGNKPAFLPVEEVAHWSPIPDPEAHFRGMSWLTAVARETDGDVLMTKHKSKFFSNAATPNMVVKVEKKLDKDVRERLEAVFKAKYEGWENAYRTMILEGGADVEVVGQSFEQMAYVATQAAGETRIAAAAGVPPIVAGLKEGLQAATYSNYEQALRRFADMTVRPQWRSAAAALTRLVSVPSDARLWYDDRDIPALHQNAKDRAEIQKTNADTINNYIRTGFEPESAVNAVNNADLKLLKHTGSIPVTLYEEGKEPTGKQAPEDQGDKGRAVNIEKVEQLVFPDDLRLDPTINITVPEIKVPETRVDVHVPEQPAPVVNVAAPEVRVEAPNVEVKPKILVDVPKRRKVIKRDTKGRIKEVIDE